MKKTNYIALLCATFIALLLSKIDAQNQILNGNITIGRQGYDCRGRGICNFTLNEKSESNAIITFTQENSVIILIKRSGLSEENQTKLNSSLLNQISNDNDYFFDMDVDFEMPNSLIHSHKIKDYLLRIPKGRYKMEIKDENYIITFKL